MTSDVQLQPELLAARRQVTEVLRKDLMRQYDEPNNLDWSIFDNQVSFDDPMTKLRGKLMYRVWIAIANVQKTADCITLLSI